MADFHGRAALRNLEVELRYEGYLRRAREELSRVAQHEHTEIPADFDYGAQNSLLMATREFLARVRPRSIGQAARVPGVTPADIANLLVAIRRGRR